MPEPVGVAAAETTIEIPKEEVKDTGWVLNRIQERGLQHIAWQGLTLDRVHEFFTALPENIWHHVPLTAISYEGYRVYSVKGRETMVFDHFPSECPPDRSQPISDLVVWEPERLLKEDDEIVARKRGFTVLPPGCAVRLTDGTMRKMRDGFWNDSDGPNSSAVIRIFSLQDWNEKNAETGGIETAQEVLDYTLPHELGHVVWYSLDPSSEGLAAQQIPAHGIFKGQELTSLFPDFLQRWRSLPESQLPRHVWYKDIFLKEHGELGEEAMKLALQKEDFAIAHEYYWYHKDLQKRDPARWALLEELYSKLRG